MKRRDKNLFRLGFQKTSAVLLIAAFLFSTALSLLPHNPLVQTAYATNNNSTWCKKYLAGRYNVSESDTPKLGDIYEKCISGYDAGYANPNNNSTDQACPTSQAVSRWYQGCVDGYKQGQKDKKAEAGAQPTAAQIKTAAEKACQPYKDEAGVSSSDRSKNFTACVAGYTGQKNGKDRNAACQSYAGRAQNACLHGHTAAIDGKKISTGNADSAPDATGGTATPAAPDQSDDTDNTPTCESKGGFSGAWFLCGIINGLADAVDAMYSEIIRPLLITQPLDLSDPANDPKHTYQIWSNFRIYGNIFLVIALLVIVFGQSIGGGIIDAYTAKKVLPRLVIATILINLSIYIVALGVDITNILGNGIIDLIEQPFKDADAFKLSLSGTGGDLGVAALAGGTIWGVAALSGAFLEFLLAFFLLPSLLLFFAIMGTVLLRQGLIMLLVLISPVAFALYCLPNTEQYFRKWWDLLIKTLLVYPIIAVVFAIGNVLSVTISATTGGLKEGIAQLLAIVALFAPLFLIPFSFKLAGGVIGRFHDLASNAGKRAHQGLLGSESDPDSWRRRARAKNRHALQERGLDGKGMRTNFIPPKNVLTSEGRAQWARNRQARRASSRILSGREFLEHDAVARANKGSDQYYTAVAHRELAKTRLAEAEASGDAAGANSWRQAIANAELTPNTRAIRSAAAEQLAATGFVFSQGQKGYNEVAEMQAAITGATLTRDDQGNVTGATGGREGAWRDGMDSMQYNLKNGQRYDLAGINRGNGYRPGKGTDKASLYELANGKAESIDGMMDTLQQGPAYSQDHAVAYHELKAMLPSAKGATADKIRESMANLEGRGVKQYMDQRVPVLDDHGAPRVEAARTMYDSTNAAHAAWSDIDKTRGWITEQKPVTESRGDIAGRAARTYERPDPNNLQ